MNSFRPGFSNIYRSQAENNTMGDGPGRGDRAEGWRKSSVLSEKGQPEPRAVHIYGSQEARNPDS